MLRSGNKLAGRNDVAFTINHSNEDFIVSNPLGVLTIVPFVLGQDQSLLFERYRKVPWLARRFAISASINRPSMRWTEMLIASLDSATERRE